MVSFDREQQNERWKIYVYIKKYNIVKCEKDCIL
jgi:hypothetical protein